MKKKKNYENEFRPNRLIEIKTQVSCGHDVETANIIGSEKRKTGMWVRVCLCPVACMRQIRINP